MTTLPVDHAARERIRTDHDHTLFVEAGAGTGKTTALVRRVVLLFARGRITPADLAAITFTEAAAAELRDRVHAALERAAQGNDPEITDPSQRAACEAALRDIDEAAISTLHGFAQRLLAEYPLAAGLPPSFEVLADVEAELDRSIRWNEFVAQLLDDPDVQEHLLIGFVLGLSLKKLRSIARIFEDHYDRLESVTFRDQPIPHIDPAPLLDTFDMAMSLREHCIDDEDKLAVHLDGLVGLRPRIEALGAAELDEMLDALEMLGSTKITCSNGVKKQWRIDVADVRAALVVLNDDLCRVINTLSQVVLERLLLEVRRHVLTQAADRRARGTLSFHDLLVLSRSLLRDNPAVRRAAAQRWRVVLVDEFQDTDPIQAELAALLTGADRNADAPVGDWSSIAIDAGRLFVVGDPKQSIYRFRRADLAVYQHARAAFAGADVALVENFRSTPDVVAWVNAVFAEVFGTGSDTQAAHVDLHAHREPLDAEPSVFLLGGESAERVAQVRATEAEEIAQVVTQLVREQRRIVDPRTNEVRALRYDDIAILLPTRTSLAAIEHALDQVSVPSRVESQSLVYATTEVGELVTVLSAIDDPTDEVAIVGALRTHGLACSDADLITWVQAGGTWDYRRPAPAGVDPAHPVDRAFAVLHALHRNRRWQSVSETVAAVIDALGALPLACATVRPRDQWRRHRFLLDRARAFCDAGGGDLRAFLEWVEARLEEGAAAVETVVPETDDDSVRFLTVHGSKGLEFPVVILAGLGSDLGSRRPAVVWTETGPEVRTTGNIMDLCTPGYVAAETREKEYDFAERERLLYVGATRARDILVVSLHHKANVQCHAARIAEHAHRGGGVPFPFDDAAKPTTAPLPASPPTISADEIARQRAEFISMREQALAAGSRVRAFTATALAHAETLDGTFIEAGPPWRRGRAGTAIGRAVHAVLQVATPDDPRLDALALAEATAEGLPDVASEVAALARAALAAPSVAAAHTSGRVRREVPVTAVVDGALLEGVIDLLVVDDDEITVIDYKTDAVHSAEAIDARARRYAPQLGAYAVALEAALTRPVTRAVLVFTSPRGAVERDVDLPTIRSAIHEQLAQPPSAV